ncbi:MAG TPA: UDP-glucose 4-epimerase GalE [Firmicutes bacterium]|uniref:UDP-glucose 4-epimerase n=1 Tax=Capillibacterium thermochitinicola TaxID=2699427 RepID=A0A8J6I212_9FIRM|nr:UDP-glucose 4-epimerase GalE [Capillibacterium thermochitinicola]MBA2133538.1 UDP-glucose 4-epimerase GalE [Capillibacterium thermochitinicola]HHW13083.1 UDP-glucose 4-epimerase GalE [Bacillota bacterium]
MKVLVAGGAGYIGSQVALDLARAGHEPVVLDNLVKGHREAVLRGTFVQGDINQFDLVTELMTKEKIEAVIHLAAHSLVGESVHNPAKYFRNNIANGQVLLDAMVASGVKYIVFSSTAAVYGEPERVPIPEDHPKNPTNPYGFSKLTFEGMLRFYEEAYGLRYISLRYFNAAGADPEAEIGEDHDPETHLIPIVLKTALGVREHIQLYGTDYPTPDGTCIRDYIHVADLSQAHLLALEALAGGKESTIYNLGNGQGYSNKEVIETARRVTGKEIKVIDAPRRPGDPAVLVASSAKIQAELGWKPKYPELDRIIATAWRWHQRHPYGY